MIIIMKMIYDGSGRDQGALDGSLIVTRSRSGSGLSPESQNNK